MHVMIHTLLLFLINVVLLRPEHQHRGKVWISEQGTNAGDDVPIVHITYLVINQDFMTLKRWPPW
jgi:hypothetical protein